jgi:PAS domain S-box-containing protein
MRGSIATKSALDDAAILRAIFESLAVGVVVCDQQGRLLFFNPEAERILGMGPMNVSPAEWTPTYGCYRPDMRTPFPAEQLPLARALRGEEVPHELIFIRNPKQAAGVWISVSGRPFRDGQGAVRGGAVVFRDVTEAQELLRNHTDAPFLACAADRPATEIDPGVWVERFDHFRGFFNRISMAVEQTADSVIITSREGVIEYVNPAFEDTTGYAEHEVLGRTPSVLKSGQHDQQFYKDLWSQLLAGQPFRGTIVNRKKSGELYWAEQTISPVRDQNRQITHFVSVLKDVTELRKQQEQEFFLQFAREVQQRFYNTTASLPGFDIAGAAYPVAHTGGDYFDFIRQPDGCLLIVIGDVSGHGFGSALVMAGTRAYVRSHARLEPDMGSLLTSVNRALAADLDGRQFVTLLLVHLDPHRRSFQYAGAGHEPCYLLRRSGETGLVLNSAGPPLGLFPDHEFSSSTLVPLEDGESLVLLTDGITESANGAGIEFGAERALEFVRDHAQNSAAELVQGIYEVARRFAGEQPQRDDITSVICKVNPSR